MKYGQKKLLWMALAFLACAAVVSVSWAGDAAPPLSYKERVVLGSQTFLDAHPDMKYRKAGWEAYEKQDLVGARREFTKAAHYGDKVSQAMLGEMSWKGQGGPVDRVLAYAWADLAAERGYPRFLAVRERYWRELNGSERAQVPSRGSALLFEYGDDAATGRLNRHLRQHAQRMKFSSMTAGPPRQVSIVDYHGGLVRIDGRQFYSPTFWDPVKYRAWQDAQWKNPPQGEVDVGDVEPVRHVER